MAKNAKKETLAPEERLTQALVPEDEQPYKVPDNWIWTKLNGLLDEIRNGTTVKQDKSGEGYFVTRIESLQNNTIDFSRLGNIVDSETIKETDWYKDSDIALSHINSVEHVGKTALVTADMLPMVHGMNLLRLRFNRIFLPILFQHYTQSYQYKSDIIDRINMAVNQVSINQKQLCSINIPLPPIAEQQRIVDRIESLFAKLDAAKELAQSALDSFETRKAAILHKAFTGELIGKTNINYVSLNEVVDDIRIGPFGTMLHKDDYITGGLPVINPKHIQNQTITPELRVTISEKKALELASYKLRKNDILLGRRGEMGRTAPVTDTESGWICGTGSMILRLNNAYIAALYSCFLACQASVIYLEEHAAGSTMKNLNEKIVKNMPVPYFTMAEQEKLVNILADVLQKEQRAKELCDVIDKIALMKKAILARAFRGELGTNDPTEESALELLRACVEA